MKSNIKYSFALVALFVVSIVLFSCKKVIQLDLTKEKPKVIIEAAIEVDSANQTDSSTHIISIKRTVNFDSEMNGFEVPNASIQLTDGKDTLKFLPNCYKGDGKYELRIRPGFLDKDRSFTLLVKVDDQVFTATSKCPSKPVALDSIGVFKQKSFGRYNYSIAPIRDESKEKGIPNWYQFKAKKNGVKINKILVDDDQNLDGVKYTLKPIFDLNEFSPDTVINEVPKFKIIQNGNVQLVDSVEIELKLVNIEYKIFRYLFNLVGNQGGRQSTTPSNPDPIFSNGALGYFSMQKSYTKTKWINTK